MIYQITGMLENIFPQMCIAYCRSRYASVLQALPSVTIKSEILGAIS